MQKYNNNFWYSVILALLMVWFMIILTTWVFNLVLSESIDTKWTEKYLRAFAWAEWGMELALLKNKENNYWYNYSIMHNVNNESVMLSDNPLDKTDFNKAKDVLISFDLNSITERIEETLLPWNYDIIPLFSYDDNWLLIKVTNISLNVSNWNSTNLVWNIVWNEMWISWTWNFSNSVYWNYKTLNASNNFEYTTKKVWDFLNDSDNNYLILYNSDPITQITYNLKSLTSWEYFTNNKSKIVSSWEVWLFKQSLRVSLDNSQYLNMLKYSIFSK